MTNEAEIKKKDEKPIMRSREKSIRNKAKPLTKVIVRRLPPTMSEEEFFQQIDPMPDCESFYYCMADWSLGQDATCRAYLNFKNQEDIFLFKDRFDGYVFVDKKGVEYPALVEYAPFQGLPKNRSRKRDPKINSIETDQHYTNFLEKLKIEENEKSEMKLEFNLQSTKDVKITSTPLLQYVANKMQEKRDEKKRKQEERKQRREEVRQKKKLIIAQKVPPAIKEEESKSKEAKDSQIKEKSAEKKDNYNRNDDRKDRNDHADRKDRNDRNNRDNRNNRNEKHEKERQERERRNEERREKERKRRQERDEKRRQEREKRDRERRERKFQDDKQNKEPYAEKPSKDSESVKRVEVKKYSESRKDKIKSREDTKCGKSDEFSKNKNDINRSDSISSDKNSTASNSQSGDINEKVKDFIMNAAIAKELICKSSETKPDTEIKVVASTSENEKTTDNLNEVTEKLEKISLGETDRKKDDKTSEKQEMLDNDKILQDYDATRSSRRGSRSSSSANEKNDKPSKDDREHRRIRNKDRPSIEIYQPGRLRLARAGSDGRASAEPKETKSNPTSDGECSKKNERPEKKDEIGVKRKVSRYSERTRSGRVREKSDKSENENSVRRKSEGNIGSAENDLEDNFEIRQINQEEEKKKEETKEEEKKEEENNAEIAVEEETKIVENIE